MAFGVLAFAGAPLLGWNGAVIDALASPPALIRAALVGLSTVAGLALLGRALRHLVVALRRDA